MHVEGSTIAEGSLEVAPRLRGPRLTASATTRSDHHDLSAAPRGLYTRRASSSYMRGSEAIATFAPQAHKTHTRSKSDVHKRFNFLTMRGKRLTNLPLFPLRAEMNEVMQQ